MIHQSLDPGRSGTERGVVGSIFKHLKDSKLLQVLLVLLLLHAQLLPKAVLHRIIVKRAAKTKLKRMQSNLFGFPTLADWQAWAAQFSASPGSTH